jgi:hypothetical protein
MRITLIALVSRTGKGLSKQILRIALPCLPAEGVRDSLHIVQLMGRRISSAASE